MLNEIKTAHNADGSLLTIEAAEGFNGLSATQYVDDSHGREYTHFAADLAANMAGADFKRAEVYAAYTDGSMDEFITVRVTQRQIVKGDDVDTITAGSVAARITPDDAIRLRRELNKAIGAARRNGYVFGEGG